MVKAEITELNMPLIIIQKRYDLMKKLKLPDNSPLIKDVEKYMKSMQDLLNYEHSVKKSFPNIGVTSQ